MSPSHLVSYSGSLRSGNIRFQSSSFSTASIKESETQTERFAPFILVKSCFTVINSSISGCQSQSINIKAPRLDPPCWIMSFVATEKSSAQLQGPDENPFTFSTRCPRGLRDDMFIPTPPPRAIISTICFRVSRIPSRESEGLGRTKQL